MARDEHEELVHLPLEDEELQSEGADDVHETDPSKPISQWKLLKLLESAERKAMALSDLSHHFEFSGRQDQRLWKPLQQLLRAGRITQQIGRDVAGNIGNVFTVSGNEPNRRRNARESTD